MNNYYSICNNCKYVDQAQMKISSNELYTSHVGTCSVLIFYHNNKNFLAHIDAMQNNGINLKKFINSNFTNLTSIKATIIKGSWCNDNCHSTTTIKTVLKELNIKYELYEKKIKWSNSIYINKKLYIT
tara:strand:+ start:466 stop:849 length:384 start_codon:yes stop_codon:yes gene_type:complete